jgi:glycosyltransferase involved in cell wall biosynthesis
VGTIRRALSLSVVTGMCAHRIARMVLGKVCMRVLHCITGLSGDGAQGMLLRLAKELQRDGVESQVVNLGEETKVVATFQESNIAVRSLGLRPTGADALRGALMVRKLIDEIKPSVMQGWMYHANFVLTTAAQRSRGQLPPVLWNIRRGLDDYRHRRLTTRAVIRGNAWLSRLPSRIIYCSRECRLQHEVFGFERKAGIVLYNGYDSSRFVPSEKLRVEFRERNKLGDDEFVVGMVGRYDIAKGHTYLIQAFAKIAAIVPNARLVLVGRGVDASNQQICAELSSLGLRSRVLLLGEQEAIERIYPGFDLYCSSSINEGFPNAIAEAMSCGVPSVVTDVGASREIAEDPGIVVQSREPDELAKAMVSMATKSREELRARGQKGRERIVSRYALPLVAKDYLRVYQDALRARNLG